MSRSVRVYRNFLTDLPEANTLPRPRVADQPPTSKTSAQKFEILQFSILQSPTAISISGDSEASRLLLGVDSNVLVAKFDPQLLHFVIEFSVKFEFPVTRVSMLGRCLGAGSMDEVHVIRLLDTPPISRFDDEVILSTIARERQDVKKSIKPMEVLGPTVDFDSASAYFNHNLQQKSASYIETLLYLRFTPSSNIRVHSVQLFSKTDTFILVATTFEGFLYRVGNTVERTAKYAFSERTLQARVGSDLLLHVITVCGLNTYTTRLGISGSTYSVPKEFPICMIGSLVWREIHMRSLQAWGSGLLLFTERDNLFTLYSLQFQSSDHLFMDMVQTARQYVSDCSITSYQLMSEAFHLHSVREDCVDVDKVIALVEYHMIMQDGIDIEHLRQLFTIKKFGLQQMINICEKLSENNVDYQPFLRLYIKSDKMLVENIRQATNDVMRIFYKLLMQTDPNEYVRCILHRNDRNFFTAQENLMAEVSFENPEFLLLTCLFLFETSRVDEIDAVIHKGNETQIKEVLKRFGHILVEKKSRKLTDFALFMCLILPGVISEAVANICGVDNLPDNLPLCCKLIVLETQFFEERSSPRLDEVINSLLTLLAAKHHSSILCPHKDLRCREIPSWITSQRLGILNSLSPFHDIDPENFGSHRSSPCFCPLCYSLLLRIQGYLCFALHHQFYSSFSTVQSRLHELPETDRPSLAFLLAHRESVEAGFIALPDKTPISVAVKYLSLFSNRVEGSEMWRRILNHCESDSELQWAVLKTGVEYNDVIEAEKIVQAMGNDWRKNDVREMMCERYWTVMRTQLFDIMINQLAT